MSRKPFIIVISLIIVIGAAVYGITSGLYPVLIVNSRMASAKGLNDDLAVVINYYEKISDVALKTGVKTIDPNSDRMEIKRAILDKLIEDRLISDELGRRIKNSDLASIINTKIETALKESTSHEKDFEKEVESIYGLSLNQFKTIVLEPQAKREILEGRLLLEHNTENDSMNNWLKDAKAKANIYILLPGFSWNGEQMVTK